MLDARGAWRRSAILEHARHVLGSALGKIGQASQLGIMRRGRDRGRSGARGAGRCLCPGARGAGRWSAPQRPCQPWESECPGRGRRAEAEAAPVQPVP